jgi:hypothetical protein
MADPSFMVPTERIEDFAYHLEVFGDKAEVLKPVLEDITDKILERERRMFETRGATSGVYWSPLRGSTVRRKQRAGDPLVRSPLIATGALMRSLSVRHAKYQRLSVDDKGIELGTSHPAAGYHETGTRYMPRRPPLIIPAKHAHEYIGMLNDFIFGEGNYA